MTDTNEINGSQTRPPLEIRGVSRNAERTDTLLIALNRPATDDEIRKLQDSLSDYHVPTFTDQEMNRLDGHQVHEVLTLEFMRLTKRHTRSFAELCVLLESILSAGLLLTSLKFKEQDRVVLAYATLIRDKAVERFKAATKLERSKIRH